MSIRSIFAGRVAALLALVTLISTGIVVTARLRAEATAPCDRERPTAAGREVLAGGVSLVAGVGNTVVARDADGVVVGVGVPAVPGLARHFASDPGTGTAYVVDQAGPDRVVVVGAGGVDVIRERGEVTHPSWSADGRLVWSMGTELRLRSAGGARVRTIPGPQGAARVFSPVFLSTSVLVAVVAERVAGPHGDARLDNLWSHDLLAGRWRRLTAFGGSGERWSAIRTPVVAPDGSVEFIRVQGVASATQAVSFQLWSFRGARAVELRRMRQESYLAGFRDGRRLWNRYDLDAGEWRLLAERPDGSMADLGCGRVQVDPRGQIDPDLGDMGPVGATGPEPSPSVPPTSSPTSVPTSSPTPSEPAAVSTMAILVGDFPSADDAEAVASRLRETYGDAAGIAVVDNAQAPMAVAPGVWAVVMPVGPGVDVTSALESFRLDFPEYAGWSWMVAI